MPPQDSLGLNLVEANELIRDCSDFLLGVDFKKPLVLEADKLRLHFFVVHSSWIPAGDSYLAPFLRAEVKRKLVRFDRDMLEDSDFAGLEVFFSTSEISPIAPQCKTGEDSVLTLGIVSGVNKEMWANGIFEPSCMDASSLPAVPASTSTSFSRSLHVLGSGRSVFYTFALAIPPGFLAGRGVSRSESGRVFSVTCLPGGAYHSLGGESSSSFAPTSGGWRRS